MLFPLALFPPLFLINFQLIIFRNANKGLKYFSNNQLNQVKFNKTSVNQVETPLFDSNLTINNNQIRYKFVFKFFLCLLILEFLFKFK